MRIHHILNEFNTGGAEMLVVALAAAQMRAGHEVVVHALSKEGPVSDALMKAGVPFKTHLARHPVHRIWQVAQEIRRARPDVMHCHNIAPTIVGASAARLAGVPVSVVTRHSPSTHDNRERKFWLAMKLCSKVIACSELVRREIAADSFADAQKITFIANGAGEPDFEPGGEPLAAKSGLRLITVGRLVWEKDYTGLIRAFAIARRSIPSLELWIIGDGPERAKISSAMQEENVGDAVKMLGMRKNVGHFLRQADIFIMSSVSEGLPVSQLEAMAVGLPMIVTDAGGMPDVIQESNAGVVAPRSNPEALANAIVSMAQDPSKLQKLGALARSCYERHYTIERMAQDYERLYLSCLGARRA